MNSVLEYLKNNANTFPEKVALADEKRKITYTEYLRCVKQIAAYIVKYVSGGRIKSPIAVMIDRNIDSVLAFMGCVYSGNFYVPIDSTMPKERINVIFSELKPLCIIDARETEACFEGAIKLSNIIEMDTELNIADEVAESIIDTDPLYAIFTSGSTGVPKGVLVSHKSVIDLVEQFHMVFEFDENMVFGNQAPFDFDVSVKDIYNALCCGGTVEIIPKKMFVMPKLLIEYLSEKRINTLIWAVSAVRIVADFCALDQIESAENIKLRYVMFSGEVMPIRSLNYWMEYFPKTRFVNLYGPTEITCNCTYYEVERKFQNDEKLPIGKAFPNTRVRLLNEEGKLINKHGTIGEICVEGSCLALGYWGNKEKTKEAFIQSPLHNSYNEKIYTTGDLGYYNENHDLIFASRKDFQIKHMGHRIELGEIEVAINAIPFIDVSCCLYDSVNEKIVCCYQACRDDKKAIIAELGKKLPKYMWPNKYVHFEILPLNSHAKIDRKKLNDMILNGIMPNEVQNAN